MNLRPFRLTAAFVAVLALGLSLGPALATETDAEQSVGANALNDEAEVTKDTNIAEDEGSGSHEAEVEANIPPAVAPHSSVKIIPAEEQRPGEVEPEVAEGDRGGEPVAEAIKVLGADTEEPSEDEPTHREGPIVAAALTDPQGADEAGNQATEKAVEGGQAPATEEHAEEPEKSSPGTAEGDHANGIASDIGDSKPHGDEGATSTESQQSSATDGAVAGVGVDEDNASTAAAVTDGAAEDETELTPTTSAAESTAAETEAVTELNEVASTEAAVVVVSEGDQDPQTTTVIADNEASTTPEVTTVVSSTEATTDLPVVTTAEADPAEDQDNAVTVTQPSESTPLDNAIDAKKINVAMLDELTFRAGGKVACRNAESCEDLSAVQCEGALCRQIRPLDITCRREEYVEDEPHPATRAEAASTARVLLPMQWACTSPDLEPEITVKNPRVSCEAWDHDSDQWIVSESCSVEFSLDRTNSSALQSASETKHGVLTGALVLVACCALVFVAVKLVAARQRNGSWIPAYCAMPLKARMNFRRKRQNDEEDPVNVQLGVTEEQTVLEDGREEVTYRIEK